ncbi:MAG: lipid-A-disaccharide synthase [Gemmatimonadota bacterium]
MNSGPTIFLSAGEASGDIHGAELARELVRRIPGVRLLGLGGSRMEAAGVERLAGLDRLAVLGLAEVVRHLPDLLRLRREVYAALARESVDLVVPIDYPGFNLPLAGEAHGRGIPVLYYIAPQVWAWKERRARRLAEWCDEVCVVLPFEAELLARYGARARFVGHPLLDHAPPAPSTGERTAVGVFPGSRRQEVDRMLPVFLEAARRAAAPDGRPILVARTPDLPAAAYADCPADWLVPPEEVLAGSRAAITKSGTITLQLAIAGVPMVIGYRVHPLTFGILRSLVRVEHVGLVNLVAGRAIVRECLQSRMTPGNLADAVRPLLGDGPERAAVVADLDEVRGRLGSPGAAGRVAEACVRLLEGRAPAGGRSAGAGPVETETPGTGSA